MANEPKILNLDEIGNAEAKMTIRLDEHDHQLEELTVAGYIERIRRAQGLKAKTDQTAEDQVEDMITFITDSFPTLKPDRLRQLKLAQLNAIINFAIATPEDVAEQVKAEQGNG